MQKTERKGFSIFSLALLALLLANCTDFSEDLMRAATRGDTSTVQALLAKGANPNVQGIKDVTPLMMAAFGGHTEMVDILVAEGADVNAQTKSGVTALIAAVRKGHPE